MICGIIYFLLILDISFIYLYIKLDYLFKRLNFYFSSFKSPKVKIIEQFNLLKKKIVYHKYLCFNEIKTYK